MLRPSSSQQQQTATPSKDAGSSAKTSRIPRLAASKRLSKSTSRLSKADQAEDEDDLPKRRSVTSPERKRSELKAVISPEVKKINRDRLPVKSLEVNPKVTTTKTTEIRRKANQSAKRKLDQKPIYDGKSTLVTKKTKALAEEETSSKAKKFVTSALNSVIKPQNSKPKLLSYKVENGELPDLKPEEDFPIIAQ